MCYCKHFAGSFYESVIMKYSYKSKTLEIFKNHLEIILTLSAYYNFLKWQKFIGNTLTSLQANCFLGHVHFTNELIKYILHFCYGVYF